MTNATQQGSEGGAPPSGKFEGWAVVEMMGHRREVGFVTTENFGGGALFRVDSPGLPDREYTLRRPEYAKRDDDLRWAPVGSKVRRPQISAKTCLVGVPSIYAITPCTEEAAIALLEDLIKPPLILLELPKEQGLLAQSEEDIPVCPECGELDASCTCEQG